MKCDRCDRVLTADLSVYSRTLGVWYCGPSLWRECDEVYRARTAK